MRASDSCGHQTAKVAEEIAPGTALLRMQCFTCGGLGSVLQILRVSLPPWPLLCSSRNDTLLPKELLATAWNICP